MTGQLASTPTICASAPESFHRGVPRGQRCEIGASIQRLTRADARLRMGERQNRRIAVRHDRRHG
jgi:hypothetical protein